MLRRWFAAVVVGLTSLPSLSAQSIPLPADQLYDFRHPMYSYVDIVDRSVIAGWNLDANTGYLSSAFTLFRVDVDSANRLTHTPIPVDVVTVARPDVQAWASVARLHWGANSVDLGWELIPKEPLAPGKYNLLITDFPYASTCGVDPLGQIWCDWVSNLVTFTVQ